MGDVWARFLIANGLASPGSYQYLLNYYENRGFYLRFDLQPSTHTPRIERVRRLRNRNLGLLESSEGLRPETQEGQKDEL